MNTTHKCDGYQKVKDFPGGPLVKTLSFQSREHKFNPWLGNQDLTCHTV